MDNHIHEIRLKRRGVDGIGQRDQEPTHSARARLDKHRWVRDRHLAAATPTWKQSSATEHSVVARNDGTVNTDCCGGLAIWRGDSGPLSPSSVGLTGSKRAMLCWAPISSMPVIDRAELRRIVTEILAENLPGN
jgi:hypothetical protein